MGKCCAWAHQLLSVTVGLGSRVDLERPCSRAQCFCVPSSRVKGKVRTSHDVLLCLEPKGCGPDKWQTDTWSPHSSSLPVGIFVFLSNLFLFPLQAAELGMVSAYYTYIFTNLVRHVHSSPPWHRVSLIRVSGVWQNEAQEIGARKTEAEASQRGRVS